MKNYNIISVLMLLAVCQEVFGQQSTISGVVSIHNSGYEKGRTEYVHLAQVEEEFGNSQATVTDIRGQFVLSLVDISLGDNFNFSVKKQGLEVVNFDELTAVAGQKSLKRISMASSQYLADFRKKIYRVGKTQAEKILDGKIKKIKLTLIEEQRKK